MKYKYYKNNYLIMVIFFENINILSLKYIINKFYFVIVQY